MLDRVVVLREMGEGDLELVEGWLVEPHVARWYLDGTTLEDELRDCKESLAGAQPTHLYVAEDDGRPIGWCQWYRCDDYPDHAAGVGAVDGDIGIDYAIGDPRLIGVGRGTELIAALVELVRRVHPGAGVIADPDAANVASRRVLERNGFELVDERLVPSEPVAGPMAVYRLEGAGRERRGNS
jgi:aminoglycoside 6'-N-acetyltransferase